MHLALTGVMVLSQNCVITINHVYKRAGIYKINIRVTDANGVTAFLQLIAVSNGKVDGASASQGSDDETGQPTARTQEIMWAPTAVSLGLLLPTFWLGRMSQLTSIRNKMLKERDALQQK